MTYIVYLLENEHTRSWYIGFTTDITRRVDEHNAGIGGRHTAKIAGKWRLIYSEMYLDKRDAIGREKFLKSGAGRRYLKHQLNHYLTSVESTIAVSDIKTS